MSDRTLPVSIAEQTYQFWLGRMLRGEGVGVTTAPTESDEVAASDLWVRQRNRSSIKPGKAVQKFIS